MLPELPIEDVILQFAAVVTAALAVQLLFERTRVPALIGLLILGMVIGPGGAGILPDRPVVDLFGSVGLLYIMFIAGAEIDLEIVRERKSETLAFGLLAFLLCFIPATATGLLWLDLQMSGALLLGAALSSHTLVAYPIVSRLGLAGRRPVVAVTGGTLLTDTTALLVFVFAVQLAGEGGGWGWLAPIGLLALLAAIALLVVPRVARGILATPRHTLPEKALFLLAIILLLSVATQLIGTEEILGAFLAGICLNRAMHQRKELKDHLEFVGRMLFIPFFFVETGMRLELGALKGAATWLLAIGLVVIIVAGKSVAAALVTRLFGYTRIEGVAIASLSFPQAAATLAVIVLGLELGMVDRGTADAIIIVILLTCLIGPLLTRYAAAKLANTEAKASAIRRAIPTPP